MSDKLVVNEIYRSIQGESTLAGLPCVFVRLTACHLRCSYCDTAYAFNEGKKWGLEEVEGRIRQFGEPRYTGGLELGLPLVELTGGEPLLQHSALPLMNSLCDHGYTVLLETSGACDIGEVDPRVRRIMDIKCPSSGESHRNHWANIDLLKQTDEIKFVIGTAEDYNWAKQVLEQYRLDRRCPVLFSWVTPLMPHQRARSLKDPALPHTPLSREELVDRIIADGLPVRFQLQMHKFIWSPDLRGV